VVVVAGQASASTMRSAGDVVEVRDFEFHAAYAGQVTGFAAARRRAACRCAAAWPATRRRVPPLPGRILDAAAAPNWPSWARGYRPGDG